MQAAAGRESWADATDQEEAASRSQGLPDDDAPPGYEHVLPGTHKVNTAELEAGLDQGDGQGGTDEPDLPLKSGGLQDVSAEEVIETVSAADTPYTSAKSFDELPLSPKLLQGLYTEMKFERPSRIQATTLPMILSPPFRSLVAQAHNGSGKTTCFVLAMLSRVNPAVQQPQALCVCPTRELVVQNMSVLERMGKFSAISATSTAAADHEFSRSTRINQQVVVGTHGKLKNWMSKRIMPTEHIQILVFDEADEMLKRDGFASDSLRMIQTLRRTNRQLQILLFSATFNERIRNFAVKVVGPEANQVFVPKEDLSLDVIKQYRVVCPKSADKMRVLKDMVFPQSDQLGQTIIFVRTRETARSLHAAMEADGHKCTSIQGDMDKEARDRVVREFRTGATKILISTDVLARGFDVTQVTLVINYDVPVERDGRTPAFETYLHRIGRSGRFGRKGAAFNLVSGPQEIGVLDAIQDYFKHDIPAVPHDDEDVFLEVLRAAGLTS
ncbi:hypothetical protein WJX72_000149 [[Myrmecia] bisecta]|uniref:RNA helicase n=1 Tax=[Myrmecia] bisecta TaxID=41462 RepID=A0AAW1R5B6_9CHLO